MTGVAVLIVAAGRGQRFGTELPKQYMPLGVLPVMLHAIQAFQKHPRINCVQIVIHPDDEDLYRQAIDGLPLPPPVHGGATRQESVRKGLQALKARGGIERVLIHDGARPFVAADTIETLIEALSENDGAIPAIPVSDTLKRAEDSRVTATLPRDGLWQAQTPQAFWLHRIVEAHQYAAQKDKTLTDDAQVAEAAGLSVKIVNGSPNNVKMTTKADLERAAMWLKGQRETRVGQGFDVHAFADTPGPVRLCGVDIPHDHGLAGHSDADVGLHVVVDALLGALAEGDIGTHFPPSDDQWKAADSALFVRYARDLASARGASITNVDITLICERPKLGNARTRMQSRVAELLEVSSKRISIKATTTEKLGFTGRREGIAAQAIITVQVPSETAEV